MGPQDRAPLALISSCCATARDGSTPIEFLRPLSRFFYRKSVTTFRESERFEWATKSWRARVAKIWGISIGASERLIWGTNWRQAWEAHLWLKIQDLLSGLRSPAFHLIREIRAIRGQNSPFSPKLFSFFMQFARPQPLSRPCPY